VIVSPSTQLCVLLGDPVAHSRSPHMLNAAFAARGVDAVYLAWRVERAALRPAIATLAATRALGANVTVPHKEAAVRAVDALAPAARLLGCINCITFEDGRSKGHNTDAPGLERALREQVRVPALRRRPAIVLGAGGAARAAVAALAALGFVEIHVVNRSASRRRAFRAFAERTGAPVHVHAWRALLDLARDGALLVNATSAQVKHEPLRVPALRPGAVVYDLTYGNTKLVAAAKNRGLLAFDGAAMLLHQAAVAYELWTGQKAPVPIMRRALIG
jgi:shikimate dehydrogenase